MRRCSLRHRGRSDGKPTRILVTGASGLLGGKIVELASGKGHEVFSAYKEHQPLQGRAVQLDQTEEGQVKKVVSESKPDVIINGAALTDVDLCEEKSDSAFLLNATAVGYLAKAARESNAFLLQMSTDYVFSGDKGGYSETDAPAPINKYGLSKLKGEEAAMRVGEKSYCIARASVVYGWGRTHRPNAASFIYAKLSNGDKVSMVNDQYCSPTLNTSLAGMVLEIAERRVPGIMHTAGATRLSRYDFALDVARTFGLDTNLISPIETKRLNWKARRPPDSSLRVTKASGTLSSAPLPIEQALRVLSREHDSLASFQ